MTDESMVEGTGDEDHKVILVTGWQKFSPDEKKTRSPSLGRSMEDMPREMVFDIDTKVFDQIYGEGNWEVAFRHSHVTLEKVPYVYHRKTVYTPVVSAGPADALSTEPYEDQLINRSVTSPSLMADILYRRSVMGIPYYRMDFGMNGIMLSRQDLIHWTNNLVPALFEPVCEHLTSVLIASGYTQNDEICMKVNRDGDSPGKKGFIWVHCTNETLTGRPVVIFCYESSESTEHLREFFQEFQGYITCDA